MLPRILKNFELIVDGRSHAGVVSEIALPALERQTQEHVNGGMAGPVALDYGSAMLTLGFTLDEWNEEVLAWYGHRSAAGLNLRFMGALSADAIDRAADAAEIEVTGRITKIERDAAKRGENSAMKVEMALVFYKETRNGEPLYSIDMIGGIETVRGKTVNQDILNAAGLPTGQ